MISLWVEMLSEYSLEQVAKAVKKLIQESPYMPKVSDVVKRITPVKAISAPEPMGEWECRSLERMVAWSEFVTKELHSRGLKTLTDFKNEQCAYAKKHGLELKDLTCDEWYALGLSHRNYCDQFDNMPNNSGDLLREYLSFSNTKAYLHTAKPRIQAGNRSKQLIAAAI